MTPANSHILCDVMKSNVSANVFLKKKFACALLYIMAFVLDNECPRLLCIFCYVQQDAKTG